MNGGNNIGSDALLRGRSLGNNVRSLEQEWQGTLLNLVRRTDADEKGLTEMLQITQSSVPESGNGTKEFRRNREVFPLECCTLLIAVGSAIAVPVPLIAHWVYHLNAVKYLLLPIEKKFEHTPVDSRLVMGATEPRLPPLNMPS